MSGNPIGLCGLCNEFRELRLSHLMPKAGYKLLRKPGRSPVLVTSTAAITADEQVTDHFLCAECEDRFSKSGERWVMRHCCRVETGEFLLHDILVATTPILGNTAKFRCFIGSNVPDVEMDNLVYFAVSVFWRSAAHRWDEGLKQLDFGPYLEPIRLFLLGSGDLPGESVVTVDVSEMRNPLSTIAFPFGGNREEDSVLRH